ncbi:MAG: FMN-binding negative transcriptional regulator [Archangium sp.]
MTSARAFKTAERALGTVTRMEYPPREYLVQDPAVGLELIRTRPFAHVITSHGGLRSTRVPVLADSENGRIVRLRAHFDARNPQAKNLEGQPVLVSFSGPAAYVSPNWRADKTKGGTYDYQEVQVRGRARVMSDGGFFRQLVDDLSQSIEPQHSEIADFPVWRALHAPPGHIERQSQYVVAFVIEVESVETIAKLHQGLSEADRRSVIAHLARSRRDDVRAIAALIQP